MSIHDQMTTWPEPERLIPFERRGLTPVEELVTVLQARTRGEQLLDEAKDMQDGLELPGDPTVLAAFLASPVHKLGRLGIRTGIVADELRGQLSVLEDAGLVARLPLINGGELFELTDRSASLPHGMQT